MWYSYDQKKYIVEVEKEPIKIDYVTESGRGTITMDPARVFPCTVHDIKVIIDTLWKSADPYGTAGNIAEYLRDCIQDAKTYRAEFQECPRNARIITELSSLIKKYVSNLDKIADAFGLESVTDQQAETMKMTKCEVLLVEQKNGEYVIKSYPGKQFVKSGLVFQVCQKEKKGARYISVPGTGRMLTYYRGTDKEAPANISEDNINVIKKNIENGRIKQFCAEFAEICKNNGVQFPGVLPCYDLPETAEPEKMETEEPENMEQIKAVLSAFDDRYNEFYTKYTGGIMYARLIEYGEKLLTYKTIIPGFTKGQTRRFIKGLIQARGDYFTSDREVAALASVLWEIFNQQTEPATVSKPIQGTTEKEPITAENTETAEPAEPITAEKPAHNVIKRNTAHIVARWKIETCAGAVGDLFDIKKTENGWTGENITRKNGKFYNIPIAGLRNAELVEIVKQETAKEYFAHIMNNIITTEPKPADPTPETVNRPQVWKPCTRTTARRNAIIYLDILRADRQQKSPGNGTCRTPFKACKIARVYKYTIDGIKALHGQNTSPQRHIIGTEYTPEPAPGKTHGSAICYGIVNRRVPRFEIRGSPILHEKKIGGFCGVYIRPPGGYLKVSR